MRWLEVLRDKSPQDLMYHGVSRNAKYPQQQIIPLPQ
jgi:hypothetical protein